MMLYVRDSYIVCPYNVEGAKLRKWYLNPTIVKGYF